MLLNEWIHAIPASRVFVYLSAGLLVFKRAPQVGFSGKQSLSWSVMFIKECLWDHHLWKEDDRRRFGPRWRLSCNADPRTVPHGDSEVRGALQSSPKLGQHSQAFISLPQLVPDGYHRKGNGFGPGDPLWWGTREGVETKGDLSRVLQCPLHFRECKTLVQGHTPWMDMNLVLSDSRAQNLNVFVLLYLLNS